MLRTITLSLLMLVSIGVMLPLASSTAHGIRQSVEANQHHARRHSRAWWRRHRARLRRRRAAAMAHRNRPLSQLMPNDAPGAAASLAPLANLPGTVGAAEAKSSTARSVVPGQTSFSVVALSRPNPGYLTSREQQRMLSGVAFSDLRRIVIDKMVATNGWVTNDYEREITGHRVFIVTAQTPSDGRSPEKSWNFYFTEVNGRIYSLTTNTSAQFAGLMAAEAERLVASLYTGVSSVGVKTSR